MDKRFLTKEQAIELLEDKESIHTFRTMPIGLIWADWGRKELIDAIESTWEEDIEIWWPACMGMWHGLVIYTGDKKDPLFIEADIEKLKSLE